MNLARENLLQDIGRLLVWYPFRWLTRALPFPWKLRLFEACGDLAFALYPGKRSSLERRMALALPELSSTQRRDAVRASFRNYFADRFLINLVPELDRARIDRLACLEGEEHLRRAFSLGRGVILLHAHFGPSQLPLIYLGYKGYPIAQMGLRESGQTSAIGEATQRLRLRLEGQMPVTHFFAKGYLRPVLRWLERGRILMTAGDGTGGGRQIGKFHLAPLLGRRMAMPLGPYRLAAASRSSLLTVIALRQRCGYYRILIRPFPDDFCNAEDAQARFSAWLEPYLAQHPGQWHFWDEWEVEAGDNAVLLKTSSRQRVEAPAAAGGSEGKASMGGRAPGPDLQRPAAAMASPFQAGGPHGR